jgi:hypothetical protein
MARIEKELAIYGVAAHDTQLVCISAKTGYGIYLFIYIYLYIYIYLFIDRSIDAPTMFVSREWFYVLGMEKLKQAILLQAELMDLRAATDVPGEGVVVEASIVRGYV